MAISKKSCIDKYFVLNCRQYFKEETLEELTGALVCGYIQEGQNGKTVPMGTPCITTKDFEYFLEESRNTNRILMIFPPKAGLIPQSLNVISQALTKSKNIKSPIEFLDVKPIDTFDTDKLSSLIRYVFDVGGVSFMLNESDRRGKEVTDFIFKLCSKFSFHYDVQHQIRNSREYVESTQEGDDLTSLVSLFDLKNIIPIVDTKNLYGIGIIIEHFLQKHCESIRKKEVTDVSYIILSNYKENIIFADGAEVNTYNTFTSEALKRLELLLSRRVINRATNKKRKQETGSNITE